MHGVDFKVLRQASAEYPISAPTPGFAEQELDAWWAAVVKAVGPVMDGIEPAQIKGIGIDGQMHGLVCLDATNRPVHPAIIWADARSATEVEELISVWRPVG